MAIKNQFIDYTTNISHNNYLDMVRAICEMNMSGIQDIHESYLPLDIAVVGGVVGVAFVVGATNAFDGFHLLAIGQNQNAICCSFCCRTLPIVADIFSIKLKAISVIFTF